MLAEVAGPHGQVGSVAIDPEVGDRVAALLEATGYDDRIKVITADAEHDIPAIAGQFDAIIVTISSAPPPWCAVCVDEGRRCARRANAPPARRQATPARASSAIESQAIPFSRSLDGASDVHREALTGLVASSGLGTKGLPAPLFGMLTCSTKIASDALATAM